MMVFGLIEQADRMGKSAQDTQRALAEQIEQLAALQQWAEGAVQELQKQAVAAIKSLEAERMQLQGARTNLERNAVQAIHDAVRKQSDDIERQTVQAFASPLQEIKQAASYVRQNIKDVRWLTIVLIASAGLALGLMLGYLPLGISQNKMQEQLNLIDQHLAAQSQSVPATEPGPHAPTHKGKAK